MIRALTLNFFHLIIQVLLLSLKQLITALQRLKLACKHSHFHLLLTKFTLHFLSFCLCLSLTMGHISALSLHLSFNCF